MKERHFKLRESYAQAIWAMDDRTAGQFVKGVCDYVFKGKSFESKEQILSSNYSLIKATLDGEKADRENGRKGAAVLAEKRRQMIDAVNVFVKNMDGECACKAAREQNRRPL